MTFESGCEEARFRLVMNGSRAKMTREAAIGRRLSWPAASRPRRTWM
jgi:hypothetical protein